MQAATLQQTLAPLTENPVRTALLFDIDGTLAPIVALAEAASVPATTRAALAAVAERYGLVACVSGRRPLKAREIVGLDQITYFGNHGSELLRPGGDTVEMSAEAQKWEPRVRAFAADAYDRFELGALHVRTEDKGPIAGFHWRGVPDEDAAEKAVRAVGAEAEAQGLAIHEAKKILEIRPPLAFSKGHAVERLLGEADVDVAAFTGDDLTDLNAFAALDDAVRAGTIVTALKIGVGSPETPAEIEDAADMMVASTESVRELLELLADA